MERKHSREHKLPSQFRMPPLLPHGQPDNAARKPTPVKKCPTTKASEIEMVPKVVKQRKQNTNKLENTNKVQNTKISAQDKVKQEPLAILERELRHKLPPVAYEELDFDYELNDLDFGFDFNQHNELAHSILDPIISEQKPLPIAESSEISKEK